MAILPIIVAPDPRLAKRAAPVARVDDSIRRLIDDMFETMYAAPGIGLAAPQVGVLQRVIVVDVAQEGERQPLALVNPEVIWAGEEKRLYNEGCLSLPEHYADVERFTAIKVRFLDRDNEIREMKAEGLLAVCIQHEIDHLQGVLFVDHISSLKRGMIIKKLIKAKKQGALIGV